MNHLESLHEYIDSHFAGNKTEKEARLAFQTYRDDVLTSVTAMDAEFIKEQPACVAMGFLGKMDFTEGPNLERFIANPNLVTLTALRKKRGRPGGRERAGSLEASRPDRRDGGLRRAPSLRQYAQGPARQFH